MKKLYRRGGTVHPSPPTVSDHLSFLPAAILSLAAALSLDDREVLAYLISSSSSSNNNNKSNTYLNSSASSSSPKSPRGTNRKSSGGGGDHPARFNCSCFRCYTSFWVRWDESPNRELIHEIIDAFEEGLLAKTKVASGSSSSSSSSSSSKLSKKERRNHSKRVVMKSVTSQGSEFSLKNKKKDQLVNNKVEETSGVVISSSDHNCGDVDEENKGSMRRFVSFVGERIWGAVWRS